MKRSIIVCLLFSLSFWGCQTGSSNNTNSKSLDLTVVLDTVKVDTGDELIYVGWNLSSSGESPDGKYLYNFNRTKPVSLEVINLENLTLEKVIPMELDGPNGLGNQYISKVHRTSGGSFIFSDGYQVSTFDDQLTKISVYRLDKEEFILQSLPEGKRIWLDQDMSDDGKKLVAFYGGQQMMDPKEGVILVDFESQKAQIFPLAVLNDWTKYQTTFLYNGEFPVNAIFSPANLLINKDSVIFSVGAENKVYFLDMNTDSISSKSFESKFTSPALQNVFPHTVDSEEEFKKISDEKLKEVRYGNFLYDEKNKIYWRITQESQKAVLTAFSQDFDQLGELLLPENFKLPSKVFVRDGMIYTYLNQEDEVYFVRIKPGF
jgi:hypothetical protein